MRILAAFALLFAAIYYAADIKIIFDQDRRDTLLVYFFAALGLRSNLRQLLSNRRPLFILIALASVFLVLQNIVGIAVALGFGHPPQVGIVAGSMALIGRSGTTVAWAPVFQEQFGLQSVSRLGLGVNMLGLIVACCIGGPIARFLIERHRLPVPGPSADLDIGFSKDAVPPSIDHHAFLLALLRIHIAIVAGQILGWGIDVTGVHLPLYITALIAGIILGNARTRLVPKLDWPGSDHCLTLIAYVSLGLFYSITLMNMQLWNAGGYWDFLLVVIGAQTALTVAFIILVVFRVMGRDYEAAVISGGFAGIALGSTVTTMAIMAAVAKQYGRAPKAFLIVPLLMWADRAYAPSVLTLAAIFLPLTLVLSLLLIRPIKGATVGLMFRLGFARTDA